MTSIKHGAFNETYCPQYGVNQSNLTYIKPTKDTPDTQHTKLVDICVLNTRSVRNKIAIVKDYVDTDADLTALTETWLKTDGQDQTIEEDLKPKGYELSHEPRRTGCGGGVGMLHKKTVKTETTET